MVRETSLLAYCVHAPMLQERQQEVFRALQVLGSATDQEVRVFLSQDDPNYVRPRRRSLVKDFYPPLVVQDVKRACGVTGEMVWSWKVNK